MTVDRSIKDGVRRYLEAVAARLGSLSPAEREETLRDVESHIYDALAARGGGRASLADLQAVLAEMDPPESYGPEGEPAGPPRTADPEASKGSLGGWALAMLVAGIVWGLGIAAAGALFAQTRSASELTMVIAVILGLTLELLALVFGILSWRDRRGKVAGIGAGTILLLAGGGTLLLLLCVQPARGIERANSMMEMEAMVHQADAENRALAKRLRQATTAPGPATESSAATATGAALDDIRAGFRAFTVRVSRSMPRPAVAIGDLVNVMGRAQSPPDAKPERVLGPVKVLAAGGRTELSPPEVKEYSSVTVEVSPGDADRFLEAEETLAEVWVEKVQEQAGE